MNELPQGLTALHGVAERLWLDLHADWPGLTIDVLPRVDSTNTHALQLGRQGATGPCVVVAWEQTAGRGRVGRHWESHPGQTLTFSLALPLALDRIPGGGGSLSLAAGLWAAQALDSLPCHAPAPPPIGVKWPNDLWVNDRKLAGILIEVIQRPPDAPDTRWVVIGMGVNLWGTQEAWRDERCDLALLGRDTTPAGALAVLVPAWLAGLQAFVHAGFAPLRAGYQARDVLWGRTVRRSTPGHPTEVTEGRAQGVQTDGSLTVHVPASHGGSPQTWVSGEVSVRPVEPAKP